VTPRVPPSLGEHGCSRDGRRSLRTAEDDVQQVIREGADPVEIPRSATHRGDPLPVRIGLF
jgi:hypothetical protein